jgi:hypothetical protein
MSNVVHAIPADYLLGIADFAQYESFLGGKWTVQSLVAHLLEEMNRGHILCWGTGAPGNWRVQIGTSYGTASGYREFTATVLASEGVLHLTSYDELTVGAQFETSTLPRSGTDHWTVRVRPGAYTCRIVQLYDPEAAESEDVFNQQTPHFVVEIKAARSRRIKPLESIPWFSLTPS